MITVLLIPLLLEAQSPEDRAKARLDAFLSALEVSRGTQSLKATVSSSGQVRVTLSNDELQVGYDAESDRFVHFYNRRRLVMRQKGEGRTGTSKFASEAEWVQFCLKFTQRLWTGSTLFPDRVQLTAESPLYRPGFDEAGKVYIGWTERPNGYKALTGGGLFVTLDTQDGTVLNLHAKYGFSYGSAEVRITAEDAKARATLAASSWPRAAGAQPKVIELAYIVPEANMGGAGRQPVMRCELAYIVSFGEDIGQVHVAAKDGSILGTVWLR